jgi:hypothetical protein
MSVAADLADEIAEKLERGRFDRDLIDTLAGAIFALIRPGSSGTNGGWPHSNAGSPRAHRLLPRRRGWSRQPPPATAMARS